MRSRTLGIALVVVGVAGLIGTAWVFGAGVVGPGSGMWRPLAGGPTCAAPTLSGETVDVTLADMGGGMMGGRSMMTVTADPSIVGAGQISFRVRNGGMMVHELVVLPLPPGGAGSRSIDPNGQVSEVDSPGEASRSCGEGPGDGLAPGSLGWVTLHLGPGRYELICNLPGHYAMGMFTELDAR